MKTKKSVKNCSLHVRIDSDLLSKFNNACEKFDTSGAQVVRRAIREFLGECDKINQHNDDSDAFLRR